MLKMADPSTPKKNQRSLLAVPPCSYSTPPSQRIKPDILATSTPPPPYQTTPDTTDLDPRLLGILTPRRLTASPVPRVRDRDKTRKRLSRFYTFDHAVKLLRRSRNIVVLSGAGISTSLNIPDFRSDDGFYSSLSSNIGITTPEEFFSVEFFKKESESFWEHVKPLLPKYARTVNGTYKRVDGAAADSEVNLSKPRFSTTHAFLALLQSRDKLLTNYTQNIDGLEQVAGVNADKVIQCHGSWDTASCLTCQKTISARKYLPIVYQAGFPRCKCAPLDTNGGKVQRKKTSKKRKRLEYEGDSDHDSDDGTRTPAGLFKPDITFFGEAIPNLYVPRLEEDKKEADLIIVIGTSLKVRPVKMMVTDFPPDIPQIWINRDRFSGYHSDMPGVQFDIELLGDCDLVVGELCNRAGYKLQPFMWSEKQAAFRNEVITKSDSRKQSAADHDGPIPEPGQDQKKVRRDHTSGQGDPQVEKSTVSAPESADQPTDFIEREDVTKRDIDTEVEVLDGSKMTLVVQPPQVLPENFPKNESLASDTKTEGQHHPETKKTSSEASMSKPQPERNIQHEGAARTAVRIEADLDAGWRWRFHRKSASHKSSSFVP